jgi:ubiquinone/menaquinone biosynthesis C-methylase UbiE
MFANPQENLEKFGLSPGLIVADLGAGTGHYALLAAKMVSGKLAEGGTGNGADGKVYAVDVQKDLLDKLKNEAIHQHITNVEIIWGNVEKLGGTKLRDASCDVVIASNIFFQLEDRDGFAKEVARILKRDGRFFFIDWSDSFGGIGPTAQLVVKPAEAKAFFEKRGFTIDREVSAGSHHYGLIIRKKAS